MRTREKVRELIEAPRQAIVLALTALALAALALLVAFGAMTGKAK